MQETSHDFWALRTYKTTQPETAEKLVLWNVHEKLPHSLAVRKKYSAMINYTPECRPTRKKVNVFFTARNFN